MVSRERDEMERQNKIMTPIFFQMLSFIKIIISQLTQYNYLFLWEFTAIKDLQSLKIVGRHYCKFQYANNSAHKICA
jgi:hypothetical protein